VKPALDLESTPIEDFMATVIRLSVSNAKQLDSNHWLSARNPFGPIAILSGLPRGDCIVEAETQPNNNADEWTQITWKGGERISKMPNQRLVKRSDAGRFEIEATLGGTTATATLLIVWADLQILTSGTRPALAKPWSSGALFSGPDKCGAFEVDSFTMTKNARGQIVASAALQPSGLGQLLNQLNKNDKWNLRRQLTAHDYVDGAKAVHKKSFINWIDDDSMALMKMLNPSTNDKLFDTDGPDLPTGIKSAETYNNFRQWVEFDGIPCSNYAFWYFQARWKAQTVTLNDVGSGTMKLPDKPYYK